MPVSLNPVFSCLITEKLRYTCTKCTQSFSQISDLHVHILECASQGRKKDEDKETSDGKGQTKFMFKKGLGKVSIQNKKVNSASHQKLKAAIGFKKKVMQCSQVIQLMGTRWKAEALSIPSSAAHLALQTY